ncbi:hypothetical protein A2U01_0092671, partial [Trifolium medium]|nr:hypothetical protein [Trifolium medium]
MVTQRAYQRAVGLPVAFCRYNEGLSDFEGFGRFLSLERAMFKCLVATCRLISPSELDRITT